MAPCQSPFLSLSARDGWVVQHTHATFGSFGAALFFSFFCASAAARPDMPPPLGAGAAGGGGAPGAGGAAGWGGTRVRCASAGLLGHYAPQQVPAAGTGRPAPAEATAPRGPEEEMGRRGRAEQRVLRVLQVLQVP